MLSPLANLSWRTVALLSLLTLHLSLESRIRHLRGRSFDLAHAKGARGEFRRSLPGEARSCRLS